MIAVVYDAENTQAKQKNKHFSDQIELSNSYYI